MFVSTKGRRDENRHYDRDDAGFGGRLGLVALILLHCRMRRVIILASGKEESDVGYRKMVFDRITVDPARMNGQPCVRHMRLTVRRVVELAAFYQDREQLRQEYPELEDEDIRQALLYAAAYLDDRVLDLPLSHETAA
jgi:uncharacterized protein (DUF433 family)